MTRELGRVDQFALEMIDNGAINADEIVAEVESSIDELVKDGLVREDDDYDCSLSLSRAGLAALRARWKEGS